MEINIVANNTVEADKAIKAIQKRMWENAIERFSHASQFEEKVKIIESIIKRGGVPSSIEEKQEKVYEAMEQEKSTHKIVSHSNPFYRSNKISNERE